MRLSVTEIAHIVQGSPENDNGITLSGAAGLLEAGEGDVSFVANPKYLDKVKDSKAGLLLIPEVLPALERPAVRVKNPQLAFAKILTLIDRERNRRPAPGIHPTAVVAPTASVAASASVGPCAVVEDNARIGDDTVIMPHAYVGAGASVGSGCLVYPNVTIREYCVVGSRVIIHAGAVVGSDGFGFVPGREGHFKIPQIGIVEIGDDVEIGANVAIDRATTGKTVIGRGTKIDNLVQIAHNVRIGEHSIIVAQVGVAGSTRVGNFVTLAGQSATVGHISIGDGATVAGRAGVTSDVKPGETVAVFPARPHREWLRSQALIQRLPELFELVKKFGRHS